MVQAAARTQRKEQILDLQSSWRKSHLNWPLRGRQVGFFFFQSEDNFTVSCGFLLYNNVSQLCACTYPLPPTPLGHHRARSCASCAVQQLPTSCSLHTCWRTPVSAALPIHPTLSFPRCVQQSLLYVWAGAFICCFSFDFYKQRTAHRAKGQR